MSKIAENGFKSCRKNHLCGHVGPEPKIVHGQNGFPWVPSDSNCEETLELLRKGGHNTAVGKIAAKQALPRFPTRHVRLNLIRSNEPVLYPINFDLSILVRPRRGPVNDCGEQ